MGYSSGAESRPNIWSGSTIPLVAGGVVLLIAGIVFLCNSWANLDAHEIMVVQSPVSGTLTVYTDSGWKWQGFGKVTRYPRRAQYSFSSSKDQGKAVDESIETRFNDGG